MGGWSGREVAIGKWKLYTLHELLESNKTLLTEYSDGFVFKMGGGGGAVAIAAQFSFPF